MNIDNRWIFLLAVTVSAAAGAAFASRALRHQARAAGGIATQDESQDMGK